MARTYAPALTKQQFHQRRPQGSYQAYLTYLSAHRPGWKPPQALQTQHVPPPQRGPLPSYGSLLRGLSFDTPAQMEARANRMAQQSLKGQQQLIQSDYKQAADDALRRMQAFAAAGREAAAMNASLIGQVGSQYQAGADQLNAMAAGGASMMAGATQADVSAANNALGNVGAPALSIGGPVGAPGIAGDTQAGVESYRGGTLPAAAMQNAGGYAQAGLAGQISSQNLRATQEAMAAYQQVMGEAQANRQAAVKELALGRPEVAAKYLLQLQDNQRQQVALAMSLIGQRRAAQESQFGQTMTKKQYQQSEKQRQTERKQWYMQYQEGQRQFNKELTQRQAEADAQAAQWKREARTGGSSSTPRGLIAEVVSHVGELIYDPTYQTQLAGVYYTNPSPATKQPASGSKEDKARTNAVINYMLATYWPSVAAMVKDPKRQALLRKELEAKLRQVWKVGGVLPSLQQLRLSQVGG